MAQRDLAGVANQQHHAHGDDAIDENERGLAQDVAVRRQRQQQQHRKQHQVLPEGLAVRE